MGDDVKVVWEEVRFWLSSQAAGHLLLGIYLSFS